MTEHGSNSRRRPLLLPQDSSNGTRELKDPTGLAETFSELHCGLRLLPAQHSLPLLSQTCISLKALPGLLVLLLFFPSQCFPPPDLLLDTCFSEDPK